MRVTAAINILAAIFGDVFASDFKGPNRFPGTAAVRTVHKACGVTEDTDVPAGFEFNNRFKPLCWLVARRVAELGNRVVHEPSKLLNSLDCFTMTDAKTIVCNNGRNADTVKIAVDLSDSGDWVIANPEDYGAARLVSEDLGVDMGFARACERNFPAPVFNVPFHYPALSHEILGHSLGKPKSASPALAFADEAVAAVPRVMLSLPSAPAADAPRDA